MLTLFMLMQMPCPRDIVIYYWPGSRAFSVVQKPWGWAHISVQKPRGAGGTVTCQIDTCITVLHCHVLIYIFFTAQPMMPTGVLLFLLETRYACASTGKWMRFWTFMDAFGSFRRFRRIVTCYNWTSCNAAKSLSCLQICSYHNLC